jgi:ribosomal protein L11 methyltransferase
MKPLWKISVATSLEAEDAVTELLTALTGKAAAAYFNLETGVSRVSVFNDKPFAKTVRGEIVAGLKEISVCGLNVGAGKIEIAKVKREDWAESWKKHFKAMEIGRALLVKPSWIKRQPRQGQAVVVLDPGLSFGTGQHATTSFCLSEIVRLSGKTPAAKSFLDIGTGSGILAIAADKLGFAPVQAFDFDPESVRVAKANALTNKSSKSVKIFRGDVTKLPARAEKQFNLVCANLISNLLIAERKKIAARVKRDGTLVLAGILAVEFSLVQRAFEELGMKRVASRVEKEWRSGSFRFV